MHHEDPSACVTRLEQHPSGNVIEEMETNAVGPKDAQEGTDTKKSRTHARAHVKQLQPASTRSLSRVTAARLVAADTLHPPDRLPQVKAKARCS